MAQDLDTAQRRVRQPTLAGWVGETANQLRAAGITGALRDARLLAASGCGLSAAQVLSESDRILTVQDIGRLDEMRRRRLQREPISRILGRRAFMDLDLEISPATLDPRADTEIVVEAAIQLLREDGRAAARLEIADLGTGSGAILIALLQAFPNAHGLGIDISAEALGVAHRNIAAHGVGVRARLHRGSWFDGIDGMFDLIISNPPYIPTVDLDSLEPEVSKYDPALALDGGSDGLGAYREIKSQAGAHLRPGGWLIVEVGADQATAVASLLTRAEPSVDPTNLRIFSDLAGHLRCVAIRHHAAPSIAKK